MAETERRTYVLSEEHSGNPYAWDFDLCSLTVGNFNYRKMSLVRDYGTLLEEEFASEAFDRVFSLDPRPMEDEAAPALARAEEWPVVPGDATQAAAVALARTGRSYIIQGPPGTGKSQTITNLIADYVARGKRVLFVCEKRAAIDVVFHRLRQQGLDELCCLIHDSQTDKKAFVLNLKQTYEKWLAEPDGAGAAQRTPHGAPAADGARSGIACAVSIPRCAARRKPCGWPVRELLHRLVELNGAQAPQLSAEDAEHLPDFAVWLAHRELAKRLAATLAEVTDCTSLAAHPFRWLGDGVLRAERPLETFHALADRAETLLEETESALGSSGLPAEHRDTLEEIEGLVGLRHASRGPGGTAIPTRIARSEEPADRGAGEDRGGTGQTRQGGRARARQRHCIGGKNFPPGDVPTAIAQAKANENSLLRFLKPSWWSLKKAIETRYDFSRSTPSVRHSRRCSPIWMRNMRPSPRATRRGRLPSRNSARSPPT